MLSNIVLTALALASFSNAVPAANGARPKGDNMLSLAAKLELEIAAHARLPFPASLYAVTSVVPSQLTSSTDNVPASLANISSTYISNKRNPAKAAIVTYDGRKPVIKPFTPDTSALLIIDPLKAKAFNAIRVSLKDAFAKAQAALSATSSPSATAAATSAPKTSVRPSTTSRIDDDAEPSTTSSPTSSGDVMQTTPAPTSTDESDDGARPPTEATSTSSLQSSVSESPSIDANGSVSGSGRLGARGQEKSQKEQGKGQKEQPKSQKSNTVPRASATAAPSTQAVSTEKLSSGVILIAASRKGVFGKFESNPSWYVFSTYDASGARVADIVVGSVTGVHRVPGGIFKSATIF